MKDACWKVFVRVSWFPHSTSFSLSDGTNFPLVRFDFACYLFKDNIFSESCKFAFHFNCFHPLSMQSLLSHFFYYLLCFIYVFWHYIVFHLSKPVSYDVCGLFYEGCWYADLPTQRIHLLLSASTDSFSLSPPNKDQLSTTHTSTVLYQIHALGCLYYYVFSSCLFIPYLVTDYKQSEINFYLKSTVPLKLMIHTTWQMLGSPCTHPCSYSKCLVYREQKVSKQTAQWLFCLGYFYSGNWDIFLPHCFPLS